MRVFFSPDSIAIVGASANRAKGGNAVTRNLIKSFRGSIYPVNPNYQEIEGLPCYPRVSAVPDGVQLAVVFVPAAGVPEVIRDCGAAGVEAVMVLSGGFAETGAAGKELQDECLMVAREHGMRLWGPNCMGLMDARNRFICSFLTPEMWDERLVPGSVSLITQSGTLAGAIPIDLMSHGTMGIAKACSIGNKSDVDESDLLDYLIEDPETEVIAFFLESIPAGRRFLEIAARSPKPIVVLTGGRSEQGARAAMSHTASLSGNDRVIRAALEQSGVILANDFYQMMDLSRALATVPLGIKKRQVAVLTFSGGAGVVSADLLAAHEIDVPVLSERSVSRLSALFPSWAKASNPIDLWPLAEQIGGSAAYLKCAEIAGEDSGVGALLVLTVTGGFNVDLDLEAMAAVSRKTDKPIIFWVIGPQQDLDTFQQSVQEHGMVAYREISRAVEAIDALANVYGRQRPTGEGGSERRSEATPDLSDEPATSAGRVLDEYDSKKLLAAAGIPTVPEEIAASFDHGLEIAKGFGFPVALKGLLPGEIHKTEKGLVKLDIRTRAELIRAFSDLQVGMGGSGRVLVQRFIQSDQELICGMVRDRDFGPTVVFGIGGLMAEIYDDVVFRIAPVSESESLDMIESIRARAILEGFRGRRPVDRSELSRILVGVGQMGVETSHIAQIDINPLAFTGGRLIALDATVIVTDD